MGRCRCAVGDIRPYGLCYKGLAEWAILVGFSLGALLFIHRMSQTTAIEEHVPRAIPEVLPTTTRARPDDETSEQDPTVVVYRISGAFFFGAAASIGAVLERIGDAQRNLIIDFSAVPFVDSTGAKTIEGLAHKAAQRGVGVYAHGDVGGGQEGTGRARRTPTAGQEGGLDRSGLGRNSRLKASTGGAG